MVGKLREKIYEPHPVLRCRCWGWESGRNCRVNYKGSSGNAVCPGGSQGDPAWIPFRITRGWRRIGRGKSAWGLGWVVISHLSEGGKRNRRQREGRVGPRIICGFISACPINGGRRSRLVKAEGLIYRPQRSHGALCMEYLSVASLMWVGFCSGSRCVGEILMSELEGELFGLSCFVVVVVVVFCRFLLQWKTLEWVPR